MGGGGGGGIQVCLVMLAGGLKGEGCQLQAEAVPFAKTDRTPIPLTIVDNEIGDDGAIALAKMLAENTTLKELYLNSMFWHAITACTLL